jgi:predicted metal-dependent hydrolase
MIDQLIRCKRRSIGLTITRDAKLIVRAPIWMSDYEINRLIAQKQSWITRKKQFFLKRPAAQKRQFTDGEVFLFLGEKYSLRFVDDLPRAVVLDGELKVSSLAAKNAKDHIKIWYQNQAFEYVSQKTKEFAEVLKVSYKSLRINDAKTRWGSCGSSGNLNITWRLIMAPQRVVDYVIIHELCHLKQMNHSAKFWLEVASACPDFKKDEQWLKENGHLLTL